MRKKSFWEHFFSFIRDILDYLKRVWDTVNGLDDKMLLKIMDKLHEKDLASFERGKVKIINRYPKTNEKSLENTQSDML